MTLTEQWKKGELPSGFYYTRGGLSKHIYIEYLGEAFFEGNVEVIAPVPSFQEWQKVLNIDFNNEVLRLENQQLKELLMECREMLKEYQFSEGDFTIGDSLEIDTSLLLKKIDNVIGEKK